MDLELSTEAQEQLARWPTGSRELFDEWLDDAGSDLQREFLQRAVAAGHSPAEVHAFADELRGLTDDAAYRACTLHDDAPQDYTVPQLLRAEADPLFAFELKGGTLEPNEDAHPAVTPWPAERTEQFQIEHEPVRVDPLSAGLSTKKKPRPFEGHSFEPSPPAAPREVSAPAPRTPASPHAQPLAELLEESTRALLVTWKEQDLDVPGGLSVVDALVAASGAVTRGIPVPCAIGPRVGEHRRFIVLLQLSTSGRSRAWQLYDPFTAELVWVNEGDLLAKTELPFANKTNRRLTRIVLPQSLRSVLDPTWRNT